MNPIAAEELKAQQDERMGVPSASEAHRWMACPGYLPAKKAWPNLPEEDQGACSTGNVIHEIMEYEIDGQLVAVDSSTREQWIVDRLVELKTQAISRVFGSESVIINHIPEKRLWITGQDGEKKVTAKPDYMGTDGNGSWIILEYKSGPKPVPDATQNWQVGTCAACLASTKELMEKFPMDTVYGAVLQPLVTMMPSVVKLSSDQVVAVRTQLLSRLRAISAPNQPRIPGAHCGYCPVRQSCFECNAVAVIAQKRWGVMEQMSPEQLVEVHRLLPAIQDRVDRVRYYIKQRLRNEPDSIPGLELRLASGGYEVTDKIKVLRELTPVVSKEEFWGMAKIPVAQLRDLWVARMAEINGETKKVMEEAWDNTIVPLLEPKPKRELIREKAKDATQTPTQPGPRALRPGPHQGRA